MAYSRHAIGVPVVKQVAREMIPRTAPSPAPSLDRCSFNCGHQESRRPQPSVSAHCVKEGLALPPVITGRFRPPGPASAWRWAFLRACYQHSTHWRTSVRATSGRKP